MEDLIYRSMVPEDINHVIRLYKDFWKRETIATALRMDVSKDCKKFITFALEVILTNKVSVVAVEKGSGNIVGMNACVITTPENRENWIFPEDDPNCDKMRRSSNIMKNLLVIDYFKHYGVQKGLISKGIVVLEEYGHRGIGLKLMEESLEIARDLGVELVLMDCTSNYSKRICDKLGFQKVSELNLSEFNQEGSFELPENYPHKLVSLHILKF